MVRWLMLSLCVEKTKYWFSYFEKRRKIWKIMYGADYKNYPHPSVNGAIIPWGGFCSGPLSAHSERNNSFLPSLNYFKKSSVGVLGRLVLRWVPLLGLLRVYSFALVSHLWSHLHTPSDLLHFFDWEPAMLDQKSCWSCFTDWPIALGSSKARQPRPLVSPLLC